MDESNNSTYHDSIFKCIAELIMESETDYEYITKALVIIFNTGKKLYEKKKQTHKTNI